MAKIANSYWFTFGPNTYIIILLTNNYSSNQQFVKKKIVNSIFLILNTIKKIIDKKSKTKYANPKKLV